MITAELINELRDQACAEASEHGHYASRIEWQAADALVRLAAIDEEVADLRARYTAWVTTRQQLFAAESDGEGVSPGAFADSDDEGVHILEQLATELGWDEA